MMRKIYGEDHTMEKQSPIIINAEKCIGCGLCVKDCPSSYIYVENEKAKTRGGMGCLACGHCFAICPKGAVSMPNYKADPEEAPYNEALVPVDSIDSDQLLKAMQGRRTVRQFKKDPVETEKIEKILEAGRCCPTAANAQNVHYTVLGSKQAAIEKEAVKIFTGGKKAAQTIVPMLKGMEIGDDYFFKGAPLVIVVSSSSSINAGLASSYMELEAESLGLGVLYSGFFQMCTKISPKIRRMMKLPKGHKVVACMIIGYPAVTYQRIAPRKALQVTRL